MIDVIMYRKPRYDIILCVNISVICSIDSPQIGTFVRRNRIYCIGTLYIIVRDVVAINRISIYLRFIICTN